MAWPELRTGTGKVGEIKISGDDHGLKISRS